MKLLSHLILLMIIAVSCESINSDPIKGADNLFSDLQTFATNNDYKEANSKMSEYWTSYSDDKKVTFILALRGDLFKNDEVMDFIANADFPAYPMFGTYMKYMENITINQAIKDPTINSPASHGILFASLMADYASLNNTEEACQIIERTYNKLKVAPKIERIEFFAAFKRYLQTSGEAGIRAFKFLNELDCPNYTNFQIMGIESFIDYN